MIRASAKQLGKETLVYGFGSALTYIFPFLTVPIMTRILTPADYGVIEMLTTIFLFVGIFAACGTPSSLVYFFNKDTDPDDRKSLFSSVFWWNLLSVAVLSVGVIAFAYFEGWMLFGIQMTAVIVGFAAMKSVFLTLQNRCHELFRQQHRPWVYVIIALMSGLFSVASVLLFWAFQDYGLNGYFVLSCMATVCVSIAAFFFAKDYLLFDFSGMKERFEKILRFGLPLLPGGIATYFLNAADRWAIVSFSSLEELGLYALAAKIGMMMTAVIAVFMMSFQPLSMKMIHEDHEKASRTLDFFFRGYFVVFYAMAFFLMAVSPFLLKLLAPPDYARAIDGVGLLCLSAVMFGATYFTCLGAWKAEKTKLYSYSVLVAAPVNILLNILLVPEYGMVGAAGSTALAMAVLALTSFILSHKAYAFDFSLVRLLLLAVVGAATICFLSYLTVQGALGITVTGLSIAVSFCVLLVLSLKPSEFKRLLPRHDS